MQLVHKHSARSIGSFAQIGREELGVSEQQGPFGNSTAANCIGSSMLPLFVLVVVVESSALFVPTHNVSGDTSRRGM